MYAERFNHPYSIGRCLIRLTNDYEKHKNLIVAFDFDNTIYDYHNEGGDYSEVIDLLRECSDLGFTMVLFTANEDEDKLNLCKAFCKDKGIRIDYINESPVMVTRKPYYNILLDDRAGLEEAYFTLKVVVDYIKEQYSK